MLRDPLEDCVLGIHIRKRGSTHYRISKINIELCLFNVIRILSALLGSSGGCANAWGLTDQGLVDVGNDTSSGDGGLDEDIEFLITSDGQL